MADCLIPAEPFDGEEVLAHVTPLMVHAIALPGRGAGRHMMGFQSTGNPELVAIQALHFQFEGAAESVRVDVVRPSGALRCCAGAPVTES